MGKVDPERICLMQVSTKFFDQPEAPIPYQINKYQMIKCTIRASQAAF